MSRELHLASELCQLMFTDAERTDERIATVLQELLGQPARWLPATAHAPSTPADQRLIPLGPEATLGWLAVNGAIDDETRLNAVTDLLGWLLDTRATVRAQNEARAAAAARLHRQAQIMDQLQESVVTMDLDGFITSWNRGAERLFGYSAREAIGRHILFLYADPDADDPSLQDVFLEQGGREMEVRRRRKDGTLFWASVQLSLMRDEDGHATGLIGYLTDITARIEAQQTLRLHAHIFEHSDEGILITDAQMRVLSVNRAFTQITGYDEAEVIGRTPSLLQSGYHDDAFYDEMWACIDAEGRWQGELWDRRKNGDIYPTWASISTVHDADGRITNYFSVFSDITERKKAEERIHYLAYYDALTGLPNRALFYKLVDQALLEARRNRLHGALLFIDLNRFKPINDTLGHSVGDRLLQAVANRLRAALRTEDVVARLGGDEFVVGLFDIARRDHAAIVAQKLLAALEAPFVVDNHELKAGAAIGIAVYPQDGFDTETLLRLADIAMYRAKHTGEHGYAFYSHEMNRRALDRLRLEAGLRHAVERNHFFLHFQPKVDITSGRIVGAEALLRWQDPERGFVSPAEFIPIAEETGLIVHIGAWVLQATLSQARAWQEASLPMLRIAINVSAREFTPMLVDRLRDALASSGIAAGWLELEITESILMHGTERITALMEELIALGVTLSLDDFGTGFSSLSYLKRFPIDAVKIDRSFVAGIPNDANDCAIVGAIVSMARQLGHRTVAEGVENEDQLVFLHGLGCDQLQGYLFSRPLPADEFEALVRSDRRLQRPPRPKTTDAGC